MGIRISEMEEATTFGADDYVPIVTNGANKKALGAKIKDFIAGFFATKNGDNITDDSAFRSAIGISAANTPFVNTGTGMTAEDVQAGIEELNTSKANISGDNIANPATFRSNIGLKIVQKYIQATATIGNKPINDILDLPTPSTARVFLQYYNATNDTFGLIMKRADNGQIRATNTISANHWIYIAGVYI